MNQDDGKEARGVLEGPCPGCGETIPEDTLTCPECQTKHRFDQEQYDMLRRCSVGRDMSEWKEWRAANPDTEILLEAARFGKSFLLEVDLGGANLQGADLWEANLQGAKLYGANLQGAHLNVANLESADLRMANLQGANLSEANLQGAFLRWTKLEGADLSGANLQGADLWGANLQGANLWLANLQGADAHEAIVNGETLISGTRVDDETDFTTVGLADARVQPQIRSHLEYNIRRFGWDRWYDRHRVLRLPVRLFWAATDYGRSTRRVLGAFLLLSLAFALVYYHAGLASPPGMVSNLFEVEEAPVPHLLVPLRAVYFSVVTMTTLGFGDMHAMPNSFSGHVFLMLQVLLGYVLLGALITRFAILFQGSAVPWDRE